MNTLLRAFAAGLALLLSLAGANAATLKNKRIGNWLAGAYSNDDTGQFSHCAASSTYRSGIGMLFAINRSYAWSVGFTNPQWQLVKGTRYPISFSVDGSRTLEATAVAVTNNFVEASLADSTALFNAFKYGNMLVVYTADQTFKFQLTGTSQVLPSLLKCVREYDQSQPQPQTANANPFVSGTITTPPAAPKTDEPDTSASLARRAEATSLIANILAKSGVSGFEILGPDDTRKFKSDAAWRAGDSFGTMQILTDNSSTPGDVTASILAADSKSCHDKFLSGSMPDAAGSRLFTTCRSDSQTLTVYYSTIKRPSGGYYVLATGGIEHAAQADGKPVRDLDTGIRNIAYRVVTPDGSSEPDRAPAAATEPSSGASDKYGDAADKAVQ